MVICCVPRCGAKEYSDSGTTFHAFPSTSPDIAAKWIQNINTSMGGGKMWFPDDDAFVCSNHFLPEDFKIETKEPTLKPRSVPTVFKNSVVPEVPAGGKKRKKKEEEAKSPCIVKVIKPSESVNKRDCQINNLQNMNKQPVILLKPLNLNLSPIPQHVVPNSGLNVFGGHPPNLFIFNRTGVNYLQSVSPMFVTNANQASNLNSLQSNASTRIKTVDSTSSKPSLHVNEKQAITANPPIVSPSKNYSNTSQSNVCASNAKVHSKINSKPSTNVVNKRQTFIGKPTVLSPNKNALCHTTPINSTSCTLPVNECVTSNIDTAKDSNSSIVKPKNTVINTKENEIAKSVSSKLNMNLSATLKNAVAAKKSPVVSNSNTTSTKLIQSSSQTSAKNVLKEIGTRTQANTMQGVKKKLKPTRPKEPDTNLIEIGPSTFLKINPDIITVTRKVTPSGNTVLQFVMNPNIASGQHAKLFSDVAQQLVSSTSKQNGNVKNCSQIQASSSEKQLHNASALSTEPHSKNVENAKLGENRQESFTDAAESDNSVECLSAQNNADRTIINKPPVFLTTNLPVRNCFSDVRAEHRAAVRAKDQQVRRLRAKVVQLKNKIEELENQCIVQERLLSFRSIKALKDIKKDAAKGKKHANFILEQMRGYADNSAKMRWSETTLAQCGIWCRKAPYAYEYFKKADLFRLPAKTTVKRFMKKHPDIDKLKQLNKENSNEANNDGNDSESSSDFEFGTDDDEAGTDDENTALNKADEAGTDDENTALNKAIESISGNNVIESTGDVIMSDSENPSSTSNNAQCNVQQFSQLVSAEKVVLDAASTGKEESNIESVKNSLISSSPRDEKTVKEFSSEEVQEQTVPTNAESEINNANLDVQEVTLESNDVQCLNNISEQYYIIPSVNEEGSAIDHEYAVLSSDGVPLVVQNEDGNQGQIIYITNVAPQNLSQ